MRGIGTVMLLLVIPPSLGAQSLHGTQPLVSEGDLASQMVDGIGRYLDRANSAAAAARRREWQREFAISPEIALQKYRETLRAALGVDKTPDQPRAVVIGSPGANPRDGDAVARGSRYRVYQVQWEAGSGLKMAGLWLRADDPVLNVVAIPDCDNTPEQLIGLQPGLSPPSQFARRLAENRCNVLVPLLIDRKSGLSQMPGRPTDIPHREFIHRAAFEFGKTLAGFEVQGILAALRWLRGTDSRDREKLPVSIFGYGEGGRAALYSAALDGKVHAVISGYFGPRDQIWREPIDRNLFGVLKSLGDAELAYLAGGITVEPAAHPHWKMVGQAERSGGRAAPGEIVTPALDEVRAEAERANRLQASPPAGKSEWPVRLLDVKAQNPGTDLALRALFSNHGLGGPHGKLGSAPVAAPGYQPLSHERQFRAYVEHTQKLMRASSGVRSQLWTRAAGTSPESWTESTRWHRDYFWDEVIGRLPPASIPASPHSRQIYDEPKYRGYEVTLDVFPEVFAYGILLVPKDIKEVDKRPVVVCQHGLEGRPSDVADPKLDHPAYHRYACRLAERGFVVFAPQNPYIGGDRFRVLQRKANPLGFSLFSFITSQHQRILEWLASLPFVDQKRIAFYGLSYGGKTAMRVPALLDGYCLSICSADYNEWIWKNASATSPYSYLFTNEYEMPEWNLGNTFNYAEMSWLIAPRPFMVERGHKDGVAPDEWVAYEFARTRRKYVELGMADKTEIEFFDGPHTINGVGTFKFLHKHLNWPEPAARN